MFSEKPKSAYILSAIIAILAILASAGGLFSKGLYRDNPFVTSVWKGNDLMTLLVAAPILVIALALSLRGSERAQLIWLGMLDYTLYNFAFYLFAAAFNDFFLVYVSLLTLSIFTLIFGLVKIDPDKVSQKFRERTPVRWISAFMLFVAVGLTTIYLIQAISFVITGQVPAIVEKTGHPTSVVPALDLSLLVPWLVLGAIWLWQRRPWGYVIAAIMGVKGAVYTLALAVASLSAVQSGFPEAVSEIPLWGLLSAGFLIASLFLLGNLKPEATYDKTHQGINWNVNDPNGRDT